MKEVIVAAHGKMGFRANDGLTFARVPGLLPGLSQMVAALYGSAGKAPLPLRKLVAYVTSTAACCLYCPSRTAHGAFKEGLPPETISVAWDYESSTLFTNGARGPSSGPPCRCRSRRDNRSEFRRTPQIF